MLYFFKSPFKLHSVITPVECKFVLVLPRRSPINHAWDRVLWIECVSCADGFAWYVHWDGSFDGNVSGKGDTDRLDPLHTRVANDSWDGFSICNFVDIVDIGRAASVEIGDLLDWPTNRICGLVGEKKKTENKHENNWGIEAWVGVFRNAPYPVFFFF